MAFVAGVRFKRASKIYDFDTNGLDLRPGELVIVEVEKGLGLGTIANKPKEIDPATLTRQLKKVVRKADSVDAERNASNMERENEALRVCRQKIAELSLPMKLVRVEYLFDSSKAIFYFTSETRVDFRELVKYLASVLHTRIEMKQIGVRDEAKMIGGIASCGRELCCAGFLFDLEPVTIKMAKDQNLALNPAKISGICGRLMCCLSYEHGMYKAEKAAAKSGGCGCGGASGGGCQHHHAQGATDTLKADAPSAQEAQPRLDQKKGEVRPRGGERGQRGQDRGQTGGHDKDRGARSNDRNRDRSRETRDARDNKDQKDQRQAGAEQRPDNNPSHGQNPSHNQGQNRSNENKGRDRGRDRRRGRDRDRQRPQSADQSVERAGQGAPIVKVEHGAIVAQNRPVPAPAPESAIQKSADTVAASDQKPFVEKKGATEEPGEGA